MSYTKLFNSIITSTIWAEDDRTRIIWITMMAMADQNGEVQGSIPGLARIAGVSVNDTEEALNKFMSPDPYSRTEDDEGRRIEKIEGGWSLINHAKYRRMASKEDSQEKSAERQKRFRERSKRNAPVTDSNAPVTDSNAPVTDSNAPVTQGRDIAESEAEAEAEKTPPNIKGECEGKPDLLEFETYLLEKLPDINPDWTPERIKRAAGLQFETFVEAGWKDGLGKVVKNWRTKAKNVMSHKKPWSFGSDTPADKIDQRKSEAQERRAV